MPGFADQVGNLKHSYKSGQGAEAEAEAAGTVEVPQELQGEVGAPEETAPQNDSVEGAEHGKEEARKEKGRQKADEEVTLPAKEAEASDQSVASAPLFAGLSKQINDPRELAEYAKKLEARAIELEAELDMKKSPVNAQQQAPATVQQTAQSVSAEDELAALADELFIDPRGTVRKLEQRVEQKLERTLAQREAQKTFWDGFYQTNSDLRGLTDIVQLAYSQHYDKMKQLTVEKGAVLLAEKAREIVGRVKKASGLVETVPNAPVVTAGTSGASAPKVAPRTEAEKPKTFAEQISALRENRGKIA